MRGEGLSKALWVLLGCAFCWPFIGVADREASILGMPSFIVYIFVAWAVLVGVLALLSRKMGD